MGENVEGKTAIDRFWWFAAVLLLIFWFGNLEYRTLIHPDEGRYAEIPREIIVKGDWTTPRLNDLKYFEKPPLQYWVTALAYRVFGEHNWTARLYTSATGLLGVLVTLIAGWRLFGSTVGVTSAAILASSFVYLIGAQMLTLDMGLTFHLHLALVSFLMAQQAPGNERGRRAWMWVAWSACALAVLSKGLVGIALPILTLLVYTAWSRDWVVWRRLHIGSGFLIFLLVASPWFIAVSLENPTFLQFFFVREHFQRFATSEHNRTAPWWYFGPILALGVLPWLGLLPQALRAAYASSSNEGVNAQRFLLVWCFVTVIFFSFSGSKLPLYILPILPSLALLMGVAVTRLSDRQLAVRFLVTVPLAGVMLGALPLLRGVADRKFPPELSAAYEPWIVVAIVWLMLFALAGAVLAWKHRRQGALLAVTLAGLGFAHIAITESNELAPALSSYGIVKHMQSESGAFDRSVPFFSIQQYDQTLPFYLKRPLTLVNYADEMAMGIGLEPEKAVASDREFSARWQELRQAYAILHIRELPEFVEQGLSFREVTRDWQRVIIARR